MAGVLAGTQRTPEHLEHQWVSGARFVNVAGRANRDRSGAIFQHRATLERVHGFQADHFAGVTAGAGLQSHNQDRTGIDFLEAVHERKDFGLELVRSFDTQNQWTAFGKLNDQVRQRIPRTLPVTRDRHAQRERHARSDVLQAQAGQVFVQRLEIDRRLERHEFQRELANTLSGPD